MVTPGRQNPDFPSIYIGEADVLEKRIAEHDANREEWSHVIAFTSQDGSLNKAHAKNLESRLVELSKSIGRAQVENRNVPQAPALHETEHADMEAFLSDMLIIFPLLGLKAFEKPQNAEPRAPTADSNAAIRLALAVGKATAAGVYGPQGFIVLAGTRANRKTNGKLTPGSIELRERLIREGVLREVEDMLELQSDLVCTSPSQAAELVVGYPVSGLERWKDASGKFLREILRDRNEGS